MTSARLHAARSQRSYRRYWPRSSRRQKSSRTTSFGSDGAVLRRVVRLVPVVPLAREDEPVRPAQLVGEAGALPVRGARIHLHVVRGRPELAKQEVHVGRTVVRAAEVLRADEQRVAGACEASRTLDHHSRAGAVVVVEAAIPTADVTHRPEVVDRVVTVVSRAPDHSGRNQQRGCNDRSPAGRHRAHHEQHEPGKEAQRHDRVRPDVGRVHPGDGQRQQCEAEQARREGDARIEIAPVAPGEKRSRADKPCRGEIGDGEQIARVVPDGLPLEVATGAGCEQILHDTLYPCRAHDREMHCVDRECRKEAGSEASKSVPEREREDRNRPEHDGEAEVEPNERGNPARHSRARPGATSGASD